MMMYQQQTMINSTIQPIATTHTSRKSNKQRQVLFCASTKNNEASQGRPSMKRKASSSVPIPDALYRSPSELQLSVDEQMADERDFVFYARLVSGIQERNRAANHQGINQALHYNQETERCLTHIMQTRHQQDQQLEDDGVPILQDEGWRDNGSAGGYYLEDLDVLTSSSSSYSSSSTYQHDFEHNDDMYQEENECIFELEL